MLYMQGHPLLNTQWLGTQKRRKFIRPFLDPAIRWKGQQANYITMACTHAGNAVYARASLTEHPMAGNPKMAEIYLAVFGSCHPVKGAASLRPQASQQVCSHAFGWHNTLGLAARNWICAVATTVMVPFSIFIVWSCYIMRGLNQEREETVGTRKILVENSYIVALQTKKVL